MNQYQTVQSVYDIAIRLMDEQNESTGSTETADTKVYALRAPSIINSLLDRCYVASDTLTPTGSGKRPVCQKVTSMSDIIDLDERLCTGVLPFGLAGQLLTEEDPARADFFWQTFLEQLNDSRVALPAVEEPVYDVYGVTLEHGEFGDW